MRPRAHQLETQIRNLFRDSLRQCGSAEEAVQWLRAQGSTALVEEMAAENDSILVELERTSNLVAAVLNGPEIVHYADFLRVSDVAVHQLVRAVESPLVQRFFPLNGVWKAYAAALVGLHRGATVKITLPKAKGGEKYYLPYLPLMTAATVQEMADAREAVAESFAKRNCDRRTKDWLGLDGDGEMPARWDFRLHAIEAARLRRAGG